MNKATLTILLVVVALIAATIAIDTPLLIH